MPDNYAPYGTKNRMRALAVSGLIISLAITVLGFVFLGEGRHSPSFFITLGIALLVLFLIMIPVAYRRGKL